MKHLRRFNESVKSVFSEEDLRWVEDCVVELQDKYYPVVISTRPHYLDTTKIDRIDITIGDEEDIYLNDLGAEFIGRLFGMMKDNHNKNSIIKFVFVTWIPVPISAPQEYVVSFNINEYDNLDFMFDANWIDKIELEIHQSINSYGSKAIGLPISKSYDEIRISLILGV